MKTVKRKVNMMMRKKEEPADAFGDTPMTMAAAAGEWDKVKELLESGEDAASCNCFGQNALYFALADEHLDLAIALYDAGARLDELCVGEYGRSALGAAAEMRRTGRDVFASRGKTLAQLCRNGSYPEAAKMVKTASPEACTEAISSLIVNGRYQEEINLELMEKMLARGGKMDWRLLDYFAFRCPKQLRNSENYTEKAKALAGRSWPETVLPSEELPFTMEKSFTLGTHRAELELRLDGTLWLFVEANDPPWTDEDFSERLPGEITGMNVGNGLFFTISDPGKMNLLLDSAKQFMEEK